MSEQQYILSWAKGEAVYLQNNLPSLEAIIHEVINQCFYDCNDAGGIEIKRIDDKFKIVFTHEEGEVYSYTIEATPQAVAYFLDELAKKVENKDTFEIGEVKFQLINSN